MFEFWKKSNVGNFDLLEYAVDSIGNVSIRIDVQQHETFIRISRGDDGVWYGYEVGDNLYKDKRMHRNEVLRRLNKILSQYASDEYNLFVAIRNADIMSEEGDMIRATLIIEVNSINEPMIQVVK